MKKSALLAMALLLFAGLFAANKAVPLAPAQLADKMYAERNAVTDTAKAIGNADKTIAAYKTLFEASPTDELFYKYVKAVDFKNYNLIKDVETRKKAYKDLIPVMEQFCAGNTIAAASNFMANSNMTLWGRYGDLIDIMEAATSGIAGKVKDNADKIYASDKEFKNRAASYTLGRLHYKAPNIIFIMTWPDKNLSKKFFEEYMEVNPGSLMGMFFMADTLWDLGDKEKATALYRGVMSAAPRAGEYFEDLKAKELCGARMAEQGIK